MGLIMRGYSQSIVDANNLADPDNVGVLLGRICIEKQYPVSNVVKELEISKQSVYAWFSGVKQPTFENESAIRKLIQRLMSEV
jgi:hypothetical protein